MVSELRFLPFFLREGGFKLRKELKDGRVVKYKLITAVSVPSRANFYLQNLSSKTNGLSVVTKKTLSQL